MKPQRKTRLSSGFSMVELVIVILIIAVLAVAVFAGGSITIAKSRDKRVTSDFHNFEVGIENCLYSNQQFQNGATLTTLAAQQEAILELNPYLSESYAFDSNVLAPATGDICNTDASLYAFPSEKLDPWGNPYYFIADSQPRNEEATETYITVFSAGENGKADMGGTLDSDDQFLLVQFINGEVLTKSYRMEESPVDAAGKILTAGQTRLSSASGVAPVNKAVTMAASTGGTTGGGSSSGGSGSESGSSSSGDQTACQHEYSSKITKAATCNEVGVKTYTCSKCGSSYTETIEKISHKYGENHKCTMCGEKDPSYKPVVPTLAERNTWYKGTADKSTITKITLRNEYTTSTEANETWNADAGNAGEIKCYLTGTELVIAGNGTGKIKTKANASFTFAYFSSATNIDNIGLLDTSQATNMENMFYACKSLTSVDVTNIDTSKVTSMDGMFKGCSSLTSLDLSSFNTTNVTNMGSMFWNDSSLIYLNASSFDTSKVTNMGGMFYNCSSLPSIDISNFDTSAAHYMHFMFSKCSSLTALELNNFDTSNVVTVDEMFSECSSLILLDLSSFNTSKIGEDEGKNFLSNCNKLQSIKLGKDFSWNGASANTRAIQPPPAPKADYIQGADGKWHTSSDNTFSSWAIPNNIADTYYAAASLVP